MISDQYIELSEEDKNIEREYARNRYWNERLEKC